MLNKEDHLKIESFVPLSNEQIHVLRMLYRPLIGEHAVALYETLSALAAVPVKIKNHVLICKLSDLSMEAIEANRILLEQYLLLKTFYDGAKNRYCYQLQEPLSASAFLRHDVFGRMYMKKMGKQVFEHMKRSFAKDHEDISTYQEITAHIRDMFQNWSEQQEQQFMDLRPTLPQTSMNFRFDRFLNDLSPMLLPLSERTKENLDFIAEKADIYGIDEKEMQKLVGKSMDLKANRLDRHKLVRYLQQSQKEFTKQIEDPYQLPPIRFLQDKQKGIAVSRADQNLIDHVLFEQYHFEPQLINVLIEYVLDRCNQTLRRNYVEKVASTWVRLGIDTKEKALRHIEEEAKQPDIKQKQKELPKWFYEKDVQEGQPDVDNEALTDKLRKLRDQYG